MNRTGLQYLGGALALGVAAIHIYWGFPRLVSQIQAGVFHDPRAATFVLSGVAIIFGITLILDGRDPRPIYLLGIGLMGAYLIGYVLWHTALGHGGFWPWAHAGFTSHGEGPIELVVSHLRVETTALVSKVLELLTATVLAVLYLTYDAETEPTSLEPPIPPRE
ncbi:MAG: hypothetical protein ACQETB_05585 [Halobacteriota archaeon]